jgi:hypothetical protein
VDETTNTIDAGSAWIELEQHAEVAGRGGFVDDQRAVDFDRQYLCGRERGVGGNFPEGPVLNWCIGVVA